MLDEGNIKKPSFFITVFLNDSIVFYCIVYKYNKKKND